MGVARFLCITIFLVFLASSALAATFGTPDAACTSHGFLVSGSSTACICQSGYTSTSNCDTHINTVGTCASSAKNTSVAIDKNENYPKLDLITNKVNFTRNTIFASVAAPFVENRRYYDVKFVTSGSQTVADKCKLSTTANSMWKVTAENSTCEDRISLEMPWGDHKDCGWTLRTGANVPAEYHSYEVTVLVIYADNIGTVGEEDAVMENVERRSTVAFKLYVNFLKRIEVNMTEMIVHANTSITLFLTEFTYSPETGLAHIKLNSFLDWPNQLKNNEMEQDDDFLAPAGIAGVHNPDNNHYILKIGNPGCGADETLHFGTKCQQVIEFDIERSNSTLCSFDGQYKINATRVTCRYANDECTWDVFELDFWLVGANVCGSVSAEPTVTAKLLGFSDVDRSLASDNFNIGDTGYFEVEIQSENSVTFDFIDIWVVVDGTYKNKTENGTTLANEKIYFLQNKQVVTTYKNQSHPLKDDYPAEWSSIVHLQINSTLTNTVNGDATVRVPSFQFQFDGFVFKPDVGTWKIYDLHALAHVVYDSNEAYGKRETRVVDFVYKAGGAGLSMAKKVYISAPAAEAVATPSTSSNNSNQALLAAVLPVAGVALVVVVGAIIVAVVIAKKKKSYSPLFN